MVNYLSIIVFMCFIIAFGWKIFSGWNIIIKVGYMYSYS
jgi:hypothetical protein